jgi:hypothetical protein
MVELSGKAIFLQGLEHERFPRRSDRRYRQQPHSRPAGECGDVGVAYRPPGSIFGEAARAASEEKARVSAPRMVDIAQPSEPGRNDLCHSGRGKRFKKCHGGDLIVTNYAPAAVEALRATTSIADRRLLLPTPLRIQFHKQAPASTCNIQTDQTTRTPITEPTSAPNHLSG